MKKNKIKFDLVDPPLNPESYNKCQYGAFIDGINPSEFYGFGNHVGDDDFRAVVDLATGVVFTYSGKDELNESTLRLDVEYFLYG